MKLRHAMVAGAVSAALATGITGCSTAEQPVEAEGPFHTVEPGVLTVATIIGNPGWMDGTDPENLNGGVEYEMAKAMAEEWGLEVRFRNVSFTPLVSGATTDYDIGLAGVFRTAEREQVNQYSECYYPAVNGILVRKGTDASTLEALRELTIGHNTGGYAGLLVQALEPNKPAKGFTDGPTGYNALISNGIDAFIDDLSVVAGRSQQEGFEDTEVAAVIDASSVPSSCAAVQLPKDAPESNVDAVNAVLEELDSSGAMVEWQQQYLSDLGQNPDDYPLIEID